MWQGAKGHPPKASQPLGPSPPQEKNAAPSPLSLTFEWAAISSLSCLSTSGQASQKRPSPPPPSLMQNQLFFSLFLQINKKRKMIYTLASSNWPISLTWGGQPSWALTSLLQEDPPLHLEPSYARWRKAQYPLESLSNLSLSLCSPFPK